MKHLMIIGISNIKRLLLLMTNLLSFIVFAPTNGRLKPNQYVIKFQMKNVKNIKRFGEKKSIQISILNLLLIKTIKNIESF